MDLHPHLIILPEINISGISFLVTGGFLDKRLLALCIHAWANLKQSAAYVKTAAIATIAAGCLFLLADMCLHGVFFSGPAGFAIPVGVPVILACGWWMSHMEFPETEEKREDEEAGSEKSGTAG
jgi:fatty acid desaturase